MKRTNQAASVNSKWIYLNYIGHFMPPIDADPEETAAEIEAENKRTMWREYKRSQRAKMKQGESD